MKYNGIELEEMTSENWDGKSREMLVWCNGSPAPSQLTVIGYDSMGWIDCETLTHWTHCAEIPVEDNEDVMKLLNDNERKILALKEENNKLKAKLEAFGELHKVAEFVQNTINKCRTEKKFRRMTHRELAIWCAKGNGEWTNAGMRTAYQHYEYAIDEESETVSEHIKIRASDETEWHEPLIEA